jgi:hypothetical protein
MKVLSEEVFAKSDTVVRLAENKQKKMLGARV